MNNQIRIDRRFYIIILSLILPLLICISFMCSGAAGITAHAAGEQKFRIDAQLMQADKFNVTCDVRLTVENIGEDWEGTVRLIVEGAYDSYTDCVYDTEISLASGSTKQFTVRIPAKSYSSGVSGDAKVCLINKNTDVAAEKVFKKLLIDDMDALNMGILSDNYSSLTYMDMGGKELEFYSNYYSVKLTELNQDNLADTLDTLTFLVIDEYDTGILTDEEIASIEKWNDDGGVLLVGTGSYAEDTLRGLDYLGITYRRVNEPGADTYGWENEAVDISKLSLAELVDLNGRYYEESLGFFTGSGGDGAVGVFPYALSELGRLDASDFASYFTRNDYVYYMLDTVSVYSNKRYDSISSTGFDDSYKQGRMLTSLGSSSSILRFGLLKFIVIVYVILVGPVLYIILRFLKKRDLYWAVVPAAAIVGIIIVSFAGRGFEVVSTRVYSVTLCNLSGKKDYETYLHCYDANHKEWSLRLAEGYEYAGAQSTYSMDTDDSYLTRIRKEGDRLFFGIRPSSVFEDAYFVAGKAADTRTENAGIECSMSADGLSVRNITNNTDYDFEYFAVLEYDTDKIHVYKKLAAGEECNISKLGEVFTASVGSYYNSDYMYEARDAVKDEDMDIIVALGMGINSAESSLQYNGVRGRIAIIGVTDEWDKAVDDNCNEESYGCLYIVY